MKKPKIKVKQLKPRVKIIEEAKNPQEQTSLETKVALAQEDPRIIASKTSINPTLQQKFEEQEKPFEQAKKQERQQNEAIAYHMLNQQTSARSYDPSIRGGNLSPAQMTAERIDPTIQQASKGTIQTQGNPNEIRVLDQTDTEPALRRFNREERDYTADNSVQKYVARRRTDL